VTGESALSALEAFLAVSPRESAGEVLGMVGLFGKPGPFQWLILTTHPSTPGVLRESVMAGGRVLATRNFSPLPGQDLPHLPIDRAGLRLDSAAAFGIVEELARRQSRVFDSAHFQLRVRDFGAEPVWMLNLLNRARVSVGVVYLSASSGEILRETWVGPAPVGGDTKVSAR